MDSNYMPSVSIKLIMVGNANVGKTSIALTYIGYPQTKYVYSTNSIDYHSKKIVMDSCHVRLYIWDVAGHERFRTLMRTYYKEAHCAVLVFDKSDPKSFEEISNWIDQLKLEISLPNDQMILVGNKSDLVSKVSAGEINDFLRINAGMSYIETNADDLIGINKLFDIIIANCLKNKFYNINLKPVPKIDMSISPKEASVRKEPIKTTETCCSIL
jgi:small GTP-binding protein